MPLDMEVGLGPRDFVLDGDPAPLPKKGAEPQIFGPCLLWPNGWMDQDGTWHGGRPQPNGLCVDDRSVATHARCGGIFNTTYYKFTDEFKSERILKIF